MNRTVMVIWGLIICALCGLILTIGFREKNTDYSKFTASLISASKLYVKDNGISPKISESEIIYINDLIDGQYIEEDEKIDEYCINGVVFSNGLIRDSYKVITDCKNKESK